MEVVCFHVATRSLHILDVAFLFKAVSGSAYPQVKALLGFTSEAIALACPWEVMESFRTYVGPMDPTLQPNLLRFVRFFLGHISGLKTDAFFSSSVKITAFPKVKNKGF